MLKGVGMLMQGLLLVDARRRAEPGWLRIDTGRIAEMGFGDLPRGSGPPDLGSRSHVICPAFVDTHFHFPQIDSVGCDGMPLLEWLERVIFPAEAWWGRGMGGPATRTAARRLVEQGTVGVAAYLTSHARGSAEALDVLSRTALRWHAGRVAMDRHAPEELTREDVERVKMRPVPSVVMPEGATSGRQRVSANPRFAISCSDELLAEVGWAVGSDRARKPEHDTGPSAGRGTGLNAPATGIMIQTHLAESVEECAKVRELFPWAPHYTAVYDRFGLLTERTILAHCIHLSDAEWALIAGRRSIVATCPGANIFLKAGLFNLDKAREFGVRLGLGSDVAAGPDVAMPRVARQFIETAKARSIALGGRHVPTPADAWEHITRGNAALLGWDCGRIEAGAPADLLVLRPPELWLDEHLVGRLIYNWSGDLIVARVFDGREVGETGEWKVESGHDEGKADGGRRRPGGGG
jgi:guanine deaminase